MHKVRARQVIRVSVIIEGEESRTNYFHAWKKQRVEIEKKFDTPLLWEETQGEKRVSLRIWTTDPANEKEWSRQHEWMATQFEKLIEVFDPRIKLECENNPFPKRSMYWARVPGSITQ